MWTQSAANGWGEIGRSVGKTGRGKIAAGQLQKSIRLTYGTNTEIIRGVLMRVERKRLLMVSGMVAGRPAPKTTARVNRIIGIVSMEYPGTNRNSYSSVPQLKYTMSLSTPRHEN